MDAEFFKSSKIVEVGSDIVMLMFFDKLFQSGPSRSTRWIDCFHVGNRLIEGKGKNKRILRGMKAYNALPELKKRKIHNSAIRQEDQGNAPTHLRNNPQQGNRT